MTFPLRTIKCYTVLIGLKYETHASTNYRFISVRIYI